MNARNFGSEHIKQCAGGEFIGWCLRPEIDAEDGVVGDDSIGAATFNSCRVARKALSARGFQPNGKVCGGDDRVAAIIGVASGMGAFPGDDDREVTTPRSCPGERTVGEC